MFPCLFTSIRLQSCIVLRRVWCWNSGACKALLNCFHRCGSMDVVDPADFGFFSKLVDSGNLSAAAREMGLTPAAVSKHLVRMEQRAGVPLLNRTTRSMFLTPEGKTYLIHARKILREIDRFGEALQGVKESPMGLLRVSATPGFGRKRIAPVISDF